MRCECRDTVWPRHPENAPLTEGFWAKANKIQHLSKLVSPCFSWPRDGCLRLEKAKGRAKAIVTYQQKAEWRLIVNSAARMWASGVEWNRAYKLAKQGFERAKKQTQ